MHGKQLVVQSYLVLGSLNSVVEKDDVIRRMVMKIGSPSEAVRVLVKMAAKTNDAVAYRVKNNLEALLIESNEKVRQYFARVNVFLSKLQKHKANLSQRDNRRHIFSGISPLFSADVKTFAK